MRRLAKLAGGRDLARPVLLEARDYDEKWGVYDNMTDDEVKNAKTGVIARRDAILRGELKKVRTKEDPKKMTDEEIYAHVDRIAVGIANMFKDNSNSNTVDDLYQELWMHFLKNFSPLSKIKSFGQVHIALKNRAIDLWRKSSKYQAHLSNLGLNSEESESSVATASEKNIKQGTGSHGTSFGRTSGESTAMVLDMMQAISKKYGEDSPEFRFMLINLDGAGLLDLVDGKIRISPEVKKEMAKVRMNQERSGGDYKRADLAQYVMNKKGAKTNAAGYQKAIDNVTNLMKKLGYASSSRKNLRKTK